MSNRVLAEKDILWVIALIRVAIRHGRELQAYALARALSHNIKREW